MIKKILIGIVVFIVLILLVGFLLPTSFEVDREIVIDATPEQIYPHVASLKEWPKWTPWHADNPTYKGMVTTYSGPDSGVGAKSKWEHESGNGNMEITKANPETGIEYTLTFDGMSPADGHARFEPAGDGKTKVTFGMSGDMGGNPINRYFGLLMDGMMGAEFEECLTKLKTLSESTTASATTEDENAGEATDSDDSESTDDSTTAADDDTSEPSTGEDNPATSDAEETPVP